MVTSTNTSKMVSVTRTALSVTLQGHTELQRPQEQPHTKQGWHPYAMAMAQQIKLAALYSDLSQQDRQLLLRDTGDVVWNGKFAVDLPVGQELVEVSILHVLCYHAQGVVPHAHAQQPDDVGVLQPGHDLDLLQEIIPWKTENTFESQTVALSEDCTNGVFSVQCNLHFAHTSVKLVLSSWSTLTSPRAGLMLHFRLIFQPPLPHSLLCPAPSMNTWIHTTDTVPAQLAGTAAALTWLFCWHLISAFSLPQELAGEWILRMRLPGIPAGHQLHRGAPAGQRQL